MKKNSTSSELQAPEFLKSLVLRDRLAFERLYDHFSAAIYGTILRVVKEETIAEDILQETFIKVWKKIHTYDPVKGRLFTWIHRIGRNLSIDKLRSKEMQQTESIDNLEKKGKTPTDYTTVLQIDHIGLKETMETLAPSQQQVISLVFFQGFTHVEAADQLKIPLGTVKSRVRLGIKHLRNVMDYNLS